MNSDYEKPDLGKAIKDELSRLEYQFAHLIGMMADEYYGYLEGYQAGAYDIDLKAAKKVFKQLQFWREVEKVLGEEL